MRRALAHALTVAVLATVGAAALTTTTTAPAAAAGPCTGRGVTVIVDYNSLGGGVQGTCVTGGGGRTAASSFTAAGFPLRYAQRQPGFVCRVSNKPTSDPCVNTSPASAYWGLWWTNGKTGTWVYSSLGVTSLKVPNGGSVAFSWDDKAGNQPPTYPAPKTQRAEPEPSEEPTPTPDTTPTPDPTPTRTPDPAPTEQPDPTTPAEPTPTADDATPTAPGPSDAGGSSPSAIPSAGPSEEAPSASPSGTPSGRPSRGPRGPRESAEPEPSASGSDEPAASGDEQTLPPLAEPEPVETTEAADTTDGGLPGWLAPGLIAVVFAGAGAAWLLRRRGAEH
ncbi:hypothetical protein GCM10023340_37190 [Nocardioides marinquilinus]|uniref:Uncharacterized protein n=1 Tax=Nocardioides marinquilinus TaxID=1210400 RepID=A0ABP9PYQ6_9ACTN